MGKSTDIKDMKNVLKLHAKELFAAAMFLFVYAPVCLWMWDRWFARDSYYSHGILVPFVTGFLIWQKRRELASLPRIPSRWGIRLIVSGLLVHLLSSLFRVYFSSGFSMLMVLIGLILYFYGSAVLKKILFPIFFLVFMVPLPLVVISHISFRMKLFAAKIAALTLNNMGLLAVREGSIIKMQHAYVVVDDVCSGLRSLIALTALGSIFAYGMRASILRRFALFLSTVPIAVATNVFRIVFLSFISEVWGPQYAVGFIHDLSGFLVFALAFILLYAVGRLLE